MSEIFCQFNGLNKGLISSNTLIVFFNTNILLGFGVWYVTKKQGEYFL
jgi:hypothetical protein